jgi:hypothetical protein
MEWVIATRFKVTDETLSIENAKRHGGTFNVF